MRGGVLGPGHDEGLALAGARHAFDEMAVHARADAEREHVELVEVLADEAEHLGLDAHVAVGHEDHAARHLLGLGQRGHALERGHDLGAAATAHLVDRADGLLDVGARGRHRGGREHAAAAGEEHHVEGVARAQAADEVAQQHLGGVQRIAVHRARDVDHEDVVARVDLARRHRLRRLDHREEEVLIALAFPAVEHQARLDAVTGQAVVQDEVAVVRRLVGGFERNRGMRAAEAIDHHLVRRRGDLLHHERRVERHPQGEGRVRRDTLLQVRTADGPAVVGRSCRAVVARAHHRREDERVLRVGRAQQLGVAQLHRHVVAGQDVGHVHLEDVGPALLEQRTRLALALGGLVLDARRFLFLDAGGEHPLAERHLHRVDGRLRRAREHIPRLDRPLAFVPVVLRHRDVGDHAGDLHVDRGRLERQPVGAGLAAVDGEIRALGLERFRVVGVGRRPEQHQERREERKGHAPQHTAGAAERLIGDERA